MRFYFSVAIVVFSIGCGDSENDSGEPQESVKESPREVINKQAETITKAITSHILKNGFAPDTINGLVTLPNDTKQEEWNGPFLNDSNAIVDPWGNNYRYDMTDKFKVIVESAGEDGEFDTEDDIKIVEK